MKKLSRLFSTLLLFTLLAACQPKEETEIKTDTEPEKVEAPIEAKAPEEAQEAPEEAQEAPEEAQEAPATAETPAAAPSEDGLARAYFASGCFWCVEAVYESCKGVKESISGYSGGHTKNPTYETSNTGTTGHAEAVEIIYDPEVISFATLVDVYFGSQNVTQVNGQGPDHGSQYRSIIFFQNDEQKKIIEDKIAALTKELEGDKVAAEVMPFEKFWVGEDYHQNYERLHPHDGYIVNVSIPRLNRFKAKFPQLLKKDAH